MYFSDKVLKNEVKLLMEENSGMERNSSNLISAFSKKVESETILKNNNFKNIFSSFVIFLENSSLISFFYKFVNLWEKYMFIYKLLTNEKK